MPYAGQEAGKQGWHGPVPSQMLWMTSCVKFFLSGSTDVNQEAAWRAYVQRSPLRYTVGVFIHWGGLLLLIPHLGGGGCGVPNSIPLLQ